ncbi:hypothetical protein M885DRAFT_573691 [Pelagophyceae sp. CCMP2097]|nr:hypothetical protein M885DRAFT_573691 [Pelagophyceae sp. CCMP2097]
MQDAGSDHLGIKGPFEGAERRGMRRVGAQIALHLADRAKRERKKDRVKEEEGDDGCDSDAESRETWWTADARWTTDVACCALKSGGGAGDCFVHSRADCGADCGAVPRECGRGPEPPARARAAAEPETRASRRLREQADLSRQADDAVDDFINAGCAASARDAATPNTVTYRFFEPASTASEHRLAPLVC